MEPKDKFGNIIYPSKFSILLKNGEVLSQHGYLESHTKPNLFYKQLPQGWLYADMRGTKEVPIWEDTSPLFYWKFTSSTPMWERRRIIKNELATLFKDNCPCRLSFFFYNAEEFENTFAPIDYGQGEFDWEDGCCKVCGKDFHGEGRFCSPACEAKFLDSLKLNCEVCGKKIELNKKIEHHVSYYPEKIFYVHLACHHRIHRTDKYPQFKPSQKDMDEYYLQTVEAKKLLKRKKELAFQPDEQGNYNCYRCRCRFNNLNDLKSHLATHKRKPKEDSA